MNMTYLQKEDAILRICTYSPCYYGHCLVNLRDVLPVEGVRHVEAKIVKSVTAKMESMRKMNGRKEAACFHSL